MVILVTASLDEQSLDGLRTIGEVRYEPMIKTGKLLAGPDLVKKVDGVDILVTEADPVRDEDMQAFSTLKVICSCRGNPVNIDIAAASRHGLLVINTPARNAEAVAELTVALMIMLGRRIQAALSLLRESPDRKTNEGMRAYFELRGHELWGKSVGLVGFGAVACRVAERLRPFRIDLAAFDPYAPAERFAEFGAKSVGLDELMAQSDFVSIHAAVTASSRGLVGAGQLALMKPTAFFINTARSAVTDQAALVTALQERRIAGAALDVFDQEPLPDGHPLLMLDNVILLPHIGGNTFEIATHQGRIIVPDLQRLARGERPLNVVNDDVWASFDFKPGELRAVASDGKGEPV
jgi:phosphoglycerate dehydrogenase-like enzyme